MALTYNVYLSTRNSADYLDLHLASIFMQTHKPNAVFVYNDGSSDRTKELLATYKTNHYNNFYVYDIGYDRGYDVGRIYSNMNTLLRLAESMYLRTVDYEVITADDVVLPPHYIATCISAMRFSRNLAIVSGDEYNGRNKSPRGAGRVIKHSLFYESDMLKGYFPETISAESAMIYEALRLGYEVELLPMIAFAHCRANGKNHGFKRNIDSMKSLGYSKKYVIGRFLKTLIDGVDFPRSKTIPLAMHYLLSKQKCDYPYYFTEFISQYQNNLISSKIKRKVLLNAK